MPTFKDSKGNRPRKLFLGGTLPWGVSRSTLHPKGVTSGAQEEVGSVITDSEQLKTILLDITEKDECVYFRRHEQGTAYRCQIKVVDDADPPKKPKMAVPRQAEPIKQPKPLLLIHHVVPLPAGQKMEPGQVLTVIFSAQDWHYRGDLVVLSALGDGWKISYPERLIKAGRVRKCFRVLATDTDTCMHIIRASGHAVADADIYDVSMGGCSFLAPPNEPTLEIGSPVQINLEWGDFEEDVRLGLCVQGVIKAISGNGLLYHVAFADVGESPETESLLEQLVAFVHAQRLNRRRRKYRKAPQ